MYVQVIPYVADQFDPGVYVFEGESLNSSHLLDTNTVGVLDFQATSYNSFSILNTDSDVGIFDIGMFTYQKNSLLVGSSVLILDGIKFDFYINTSVPSDVFYYGTESIDFGINTVEANRSNFPTLSEENISGSIYSDREYGFFTDVSYVDTIVFENTDVVISEPNTKTESTSISVGSLSYSLPASTNMESRLAKQHISYLNLESNQVESTSIKFIEFISSSWNTSQETNNPSFTM